MSTETSRRLDSGEHMQRDEQSREGPFGCRDGELNDAELDSVVGGLERPLVSPNDPARPGVDAEGSER